MKTLDNIPAQESGEIWLNSFLLKREVELDHLIELSPNEVDRVIVETKTVITDPETSRGKRLLCGYFLEKALLVRTDRKEANK
jgi:hypothetical protein